MLLSKTTVEVHKSGYMKADVIVAFSYTKANSNFDWRVEGGSEGSRTGIMVRATTI